jgi:hypothetical protein
MRQVQDLQDKVDTISRYYNWRFTVKICQQGRIFSAEIMEGKISKTIHLDRLSCIHEKMHGKVIDYIRDELDMLVIGDSLSKIENEEELVDLKDFLGL